jgi:hypothetical protein
MEIAGSSKAMEGYSKDRRSRFLRKVHRSIYLNLTIQQIFFETLIPMYQKVR